MRTARSRTSREYLFALVIGVSSQHKRSPAIPGRFTLNQGGLVLGTDTAIRINTSGAGYVDGPILTGIVVTGVDFWLQTQALASYREAFSLHQSNADRMMIEHTTTGTIKARQNPSGFVLTSDQAVSINEPHYVALWYEPSMNKTYMMIDGVTQQNTYIGNLLAVNNPEVLIAALRYNNKIYKRYLGIIDDVAIYDGAVTAATFSAHYASGALGGGQGINFSYDANGNRLTRDNGTIQTLAYQSSSNQLASVGGASITHDAAGNRTSSPGGTVVYGYDDSGRLDTVTSGGNHIATYIHNALGQRSKKTTGGSETVYLYDLSGQLIAEHDGSGTLIRDYVWLDTAPVAQIDSGEVFSYIGFDHLKTPRTATNDAQTIVWRWGGDAFGASLADQDPDGDSTATVVNLRYPGQYYDAETGLHYNYFRTYDPSTGRYLESDPIGLLGGLNTYSYVGGNPLSYFDFFGLDVDLNLLPLSDPTRPGQPAHSHVKEVTPPDGSISVSAHGNPRSMENRMGPMTPRSLSEKILTLPNYDPDAPIYLYSCETGKGDNSFAEQLKKLLPNPVIAPEEMISVDSRGNVSPAPELWRRFE